MILCCLLSLLVHVEFEIAWKESCALVNFVLSEWCSLKWLEDSLDFSENWTCSRSTVHVYYLVYFYSPNFSLIPLIILYFQPYTAVYCYRPLLTLGCAYLCFPVTIQLTHLRDPRALSSELGPFLNLSSYQLLDGLILQKVTMNRRKKIPYTADPVIWREFFLEVRDHHSWVENGHRYNTS